MRYHFFLHVLCSKGVNPTKGTLASYKDKPVAIDSKLCTTCRYGWHES